jgi:glycosyltransferase involved in cell wall biosynthesis
MTGSATASRLGVVVIGRNEGERLRRCLQSLGGATSFVVYVDSGSADNSKAIASGLGAEVIDLDLRTAFTAARARNAGFERLITRAPGLDYVFFVDGDCEVHADWIPKASGFLDDHPDFAVVWGRRREKFPESSVYNALCDLEWANFPLGETKACGGDAVMRADAFRSVSGYRPDLICGEEPELCLRMRQKGWRIWHLDAEMTLHDAAIHRFGQWWKRMLRGGYGFAQGAAIHGAPPERHWVAESRRARVWGFWIPAVVLVAVIVFGWWALALVLIYPVQIIRLTYRRGDLSKLTWWWAGAMVIGKFPELLGQLKYRLDRLRRVNSQLIEYK